MMQQLGIKALHPGPSGNEATPNHANYDESAANPFPDYPEILKLKDGRLVTTPKMWWSERPPKAYQVWADALKPIFRNCSDRPAPRTARCAQPVIRARNAEEARHSGLRSGRHQNDAIRLSNRAGTLISH
jgi:hypothetical protein